MAKGRRRARDRRAAKDGTGAAPVGGGHRSPVPRIPAWLPPTLFVGVALLLFRAFVFSDGMLFGNDTLGLGYVARAFYAEALGQLGTLPSWSPLILGGTPFLEALSGGDSLYPPSVLLLLLLEPYRALGWKLVLHIGAAGFFMSGWIRALGGTRPAALLGGTAYMLAPFLVSLVQPGHDGKIFVTSLAPLLFWAVERYFQRGGLRAFSSVALVIALVILTTHFQMAYFLFGAVGAYAIFRALETWRFGDGAGASPPGEGEAAIQSSARGRIALTRFGLFLAAALTGAGIAGVQLLPAVSYVTEHSRRVQTTRDAAGESGVAWSSSWSLHPEEALAMIIPEFAGNNSGGADWSQGTYWGRNGTKDNHEGSGVVVLFLAAAALAGTYRRRTRWFFAGLGALALLFALGAHTPVWRLFYEVVPGIRLFRAPSQVMFLFAFGASTLAALLLDDLLLRPPKDASRRPHLDTVLWSGVALTGLLALLAASGALTSLWTSTLFSEADPGRLQRLAALEPFITRGAWASFGVVLAATGGVWAFRRTLLPPAGLVALFVLLVAVDGLRISGGFIQILDFDEWTTQDANVQEVLRREEGSTEPYRMLSFRQAGQDVRPALAGIELAAGHHPNDLSRYRELIGMVGSGLPMNLLDADIRRLLNVRYILWPDLQFGQSMAGSVVSRTALADGRPYETVLYEDGLPRARLVGEVVVRSDADAIGYMLSDAFDPDREVVLVEDPPLALGGGTPVGSVSWIERTPNRLRLTVETDRAALLVVSDNWFPAWKATVDGEEAPVLRAYHTLRAVPVGAGTQELEMFYRSELITWSLRLSLLLLVALLGVTAWGTWRGHEGPSEA